MALFLHQNDTQLWPGILRECAPSSNAQGSDQFYHDTYA